MIVMIWIPAAAEPSRCHNGADVMPIQTREGGQGDASNV